LCAAAKENLRFGTVPESVRGGTRWSEFSASKGTFRGPMIGASELCGSKAMLGT
jgi:hypothetical protein